MLACARNVAANLERQKLWSPHGFWRFSRSQAIVLNHTSPATKTAFMQHIYNTPLCNASKELDPLSHIEFKFNI
jgi:hypothetical protein